MPTYDLISRTTLSSDQATVTFSSITGSYADLVLICNVGATTSNSGFTLEFNGDTGNNYSVTRVYGDGSTATSDRASNQPHTNIGFTGSASAGTQIVNLQNYSNTTTYKTVLGRTSVVGARVMTTVGLWRSTSAITSVTIGMLAANLPSGSTFSLFGIAG